MVLAQTKLIVFKNQVAIVKGVKVKIYQNVKFVHLDSHLIKKNVKIVG